MPRLSHTWWTVSGPEVPSGHIGTHIGSGAVALGTGVCLCFTEDKAAVLNQGGRGWLVFSEKTPRSLNLEPGDKKEKFGRRSLLPFERSLDWVSSQFFKLPLRLLIIRLKGRPWKCSQGKSLRLTGASNNLSC